MSEKRRQTARASRLAAVGLSAMLAAAWLYPSTAVDENKAPPPEPVLSLHALASADLFRQVETSLVSSLGLRAAAVRLISGATVAAGASPTASVHIGTNGEPFLSADFTSQCNFDLEAQHFDEQITETEASLAAKGIYFLYSVVPDKGSIQRDRLGPFSDGLLACSDPARSYLEQLGARGVEGTDPVLTAWGEFDAAYAAGESLYFYNDSHWDYDGAALFSNLLLERLQRDGQASAQLMAGAAMREQPVEHSGDLSVLMGTTSTVPATALTTERTGVTTTHTSETLSSGFVAQQWVSHSETLPLILGRTLFIHDSMFGYNLDILTPYFADITAVPLQALGDPGALGSVGGYDRVIVQQVQRTVPSMVDSILNASWITGP